MKAIDEAHAALMTWHADPAVNRDYTVSAGDKLALTLEAVLTAHEEQHKANQTLTDATLALAADYGRARRAFREIRERMRDEDLPIHIAADIEQIICETGGDFGDG